MIQPVACEQVACFVHYSLFRAITGRWSRATSYASWKILYKTTPLTPPEGNTSMFSNPTLLQSQHPIIYHINMSWGSYQVPYKYVLGQLLQALISARATEVHGHPHPPHVLLLSPFSFCQGRGEGGKDGRVRGPQRRELRGYGEAEGEGQRDALLPLRGAPARVSRRRYGSRRCLCVLI